VVRARRRTLEPVCPDQMGAVRAVRRGRPVDPVAQALVHVAQVLEGAEQDGFADSVEELAVARKVGVLWGLILPASLLHPLYQQFCGQGRGRTADLPIFRTPVPCPSPIGTVRDLRWSVLATVGGRPRTNANETGKGDGSKAPTAPFDTGLGNRCSIP
jgi:hypothetical protein